jgi:hypothetical protein
MVRSELREIKVNKIRKMHCQGDPSIISHLAHVI